MNSATSNLSGREILLGVSGGVAAYKSAQLTSLLVQGGASVSVVMTQAATKFVGAATFEALSGRKVALHSFDSHAFPLGAHIELAEKAELMIVAPATANAIAKAANGIADDLLSTLFLSFEGPILMAPAMNCEMWDKPAVQRNLKQVADDGVQIVGPESGWLSCRKQGTGRMSDPAKILDAIVDQLQS